MNLNLNYRWFGWFGVVPTSSQNPIIQYFRGTNPNSYKCGRVVRWFARICVLRWQFLYKEENFFRKLIKSRSLQKKRTTEPPYPIIQYFRGTNPNSYKCGFANWSELHRTTRTTPSLLNLSEPPQQITLKTSGQRAEGRGK